MKGVNFMGRKRLLFLLLFISAFIWLFSDYCIAADGIYERNGEVFVMIGSGSYMGVYANESVDHATGSHVKIPDTDARPKLFPATLSNMVDYRALAIDQFRNMYVLSAFIDPGLIDIPANNYTPIDPPLLEGIIGIGADSSGVPYYDICNYLAGSNNPGDNHGTEHIVSMANHYSGGGEGLHYMDTNASRGPAGAPTGVDGSSPAKGSVAYYRAKPALASTPEARFRRIKKLSAGFPWYIGYTDDAASGASADGKYINLQRRWDFQIQRVHLWTDYWVDWVPAGIPGLPNNYPIAKPDPKKLENVFDTTNLKFTAQFTNPCGDAHGCNPVPKDTSISTDARLSFSCTGGGRRYGYASLPHPTIKKGSMTFLGSPIVFGYPNADSEANVYVTTDPNPAFSGSRWNSPVPSVPGSGFQKPPRRIDNPIDDKTLSIGAATMNQDYDWLYAAPEVNSDPDGKLISFCASDQWDGNGGVIYKLLQPKGDEKKVNKIIKWQKYKGYEKDTDDPDGIKTGSISVAPDVVCIAPNGNGNVYWLTKPRALFDNRAIATGKILHPTSDAVVAAPVPTGSVENGVPIAAWRKFYNARAVTELYEYDYSSKTIGKTPINTFTVANAEIYVVEYFNASTGAFIRRFNPALVTNVGDIRLGLATINLAGPPRGSNERNCVDIYSPNVPAGTVPAKGITINELDPSNKLVTRKIVPEMVDEVTEDEEYVAAMENPPEFLHDVVGKNKISGSMLLNRDFNGNGIIGGFSYAVQQQTASYFWRVEMIEPIRKVITSDINMAYPSSVVAGAPNFKSVSAQPDGWPASVPFVSGTWVQSIPFDSGANKCEAVAKFAYTPKEPGVYKISLMASAKFWQYENMGYPSYLYQRADKAAPAKTPQFLYFDNGAVRNGGEKPDADEGYIAERYLVVAAKQPKPNDYITGIKITVDNSSFNENTIKTFTASAKLKFVRSYRHNVSKKDQPDKHFMETCNGIGCWDYPDTMENGVGSWNLPADNSASENYTKGGPAHPTNYKAGGDNKEIQLRNYGEKPDPGVNISSLPAKLAPYFSLGGKNPVMWGESQTGGPVWIEGVGTQSNPKLPITMADKASIGYEWYIVAENKQIDKNNSSSGSQYIGINGSGKNAFEPKSEFCIARGRLSDGDANALLGTTGKFKDNATSVVEWPNGLVSPNPDETREIAVNVKLRYAFNMPLDPGKYYVYIKFTYPKVKWEGRSPKLKSDGTIEKDSEGNPKYAYYDLCDDGVDTTGYNSVNWDSSADSYHIDSKPYGLAVTVEDKQAPMAYFESQVNPGDPTSGASSSGSHFIGGSTGDSYPSSITFSVWDNNPNKVFGNCSLRGLTGANRDEIAKKTVFDTITAGKETDEVLYFNENTVKAVLNSTITPFAKWGIPQEVCDPKTSQPSGAADGSMLQGSAFNHDNYYPGYKDGVAPCRHAVFVAKAQIPELVAERIPYDMAGSLPLYVDGVDGSNNIVYDANGDGVIIANNGNGGEINLGVSASSSYPSTSKLEYNNAPAYIEIRDNDAPTLRFKVLQTHQNAYREYDITNGDSKAFHESYKDTTLFDQDSLKLSLAPATSGKSDLRITRISAAKEKTSVLTSPKLSMLGKTKDELTAADCVKFVDNAVAPAKNGYYITFNKPAAKDAVYFTSFANDYCQNGVYYYDFDEILTSSTAAAMPAPAVGQEAETLEITEDSRTRFEITAYDNVEGALPLNIGPNGNSYIDLTSNFSDEPNEVTQFLDFTKWLPLNGNPRVVYSIFRKPSNIAEKPYIFLAVKDTSGNAVLMKVKIAVLHTYFLKNTLNIENRRTAE